MSNKADPDTGVEVNTGQLIVLIFGDSNFGLLESDMRLCSSVGIAYVGFSDGSCFICVSAGVMIAMLLLFSTLLVPAPVVFWSSVWAEKKKKTMCIDNSFTSGKYFHSFLAPTPSLDTSVSLYSVELEDFQRFCVSFFSF